MCFTPCLWGLVEMIEKRYVNVE